MNEIALHIEFLLHSNDCVIVPDLGGFVVNTTGVEKSGLWGLNAPKLELLFNSKLSYNDGLLAESLMKTNCISFDDAMKKISDGCEELKKKLASCGMVSWDNLGVFKADDQNNIIFIPNKEFVRPHFLGLTNARFKPAILKVPVTSNKEEAIPVKSIMKYVSTAIAAAVVLFVVVLSYNNSNSPSQYAEIVSKPLIFKNKDATNLANTQLSTSAVVNKEAPTSEDVSVITKSETPSTRFYVIVGVYEVRESAEKILSRLKQQGFGSASMIERPGRLDVYSAAFSTRDEAQSYLQNLHADNPEYSDAWILKR